MGGMVGEGSPPKIRREESKQSEEPGYRLSDGFKNHFLLIPENKGPGQDAKAVCNPHQDCKTLSSKCLLYLAFLKQMSFLFLHITRRKL